MVEEAESLGLVAACLTGIFLISCKPIFIARGWIGNKDGFNTLAQGILYIFIVLFILLFIAFIIVGWI